MNNMNQFKIEYGVERIIKLAIICIIISNIGGFCCGHIIGEYQAKKTMQKKYFLIEKDAPKIT